MSELLSILIPVRNEKDNIHIISKDINEKIKNSNFEIVFINDFSEDSTEADLKKICELDTKIFYHNNKKKGLGGAIDLGIRKSKGKYICIMMADSSDTVEDLNCYYEEITSGDYDAVFGSRFINPIDPLKGGMPLNRYIGNRVVTFIQNFIVGTKMTEFHSGYRSYKIEVLKKINFEKNTNDFYFDSEMIIQMFKSKFVIKEIPRATIYGDEISNLKPIPYGIKVLIITIKHKFFDKD